MSFGSIQACVRPLLFPLMKPEIKTPCFSVTPMCAILFSSIPHMDFNPLGENFRGTRASCLPNFVDLLRLYSSCPIFACPPPTFSYQATRPRKLNGCVILEIDQTLHGTRVAGAVPGLMCLLQLHTDPFPK